MWMLYRKVLWRSVGWEASSTGTTFPQLHPTHSEKHGLLHR